MKVTRIIDAQVGDALKHRDTLIIETRDPPEVTEASERARGRAMYGPANWVRGVSCGRRECPGHDTCRHDHCKPRDEDGEPQSYAPHGAAVPLQTFVEKFLHEHCSYGTYTAKAYATQFMTMWRAEP